MESEVSVLSVLDVRQAAAECADRWVTSIRRVWGVPEGGREPARLVADVLGAAWLVSPTPPAPADDLLVVDDLVDSGATLKRYSQQGYRVDALYRKGHTPDWLAADAIQRDGWLVFPWEAQPDGTGQVGPVDAVVRLLQWIGEDPEREGLTDTPGRVVRALQEMTAGQREDPAAILGTVFEASADQLVILDGIEFTSLCEHHLLPFVGTAAVGYIPKDGKVVGISKLARLVECFARRLQLQERMTQQIADALERHLSPHGVGVLVRAHHSCMGCRGVRKPEAVMTTSAMLGYLRVDQNARSEFLALAKGER